MENKLARLFKNTGALRFFAPVGVILLVMGIVLLLHTPKEYSETAGIVTDVREYVEDGNTLYEATFDYTVDGWRYSDSFDGLTEAPSVGDEIPVFYDPADPLHISNTRHTGVIAIGMIVLGAAALLYGVLACLKAFRKSRELDETARAAGGVSEVIPVPREQLTEYYVSFDGQTLRPGYVVENRSRTVIYEAPMTKNALVGSRVFTFIDHRTGRRDEHQVGHTVTTSYDNEFFSVSSWFKFDGKNIWDVLHERGVRIATDLRSQFPKTVYTVSVNGRFLATVETSGRYVHEEDEAEHKVNLPTGRYYYRCWTDAEDLELLFLTVFALSESEQDVAE